MKLPLPRQPRALLVLLLLQLAACVAPPTPRATVRLALVGSDSMLWLARALTDAYSQQHPTVQFHIQASNSEAALTRAGEDARTIGMISRQVRPSELSQVRAIAIARDGIAVIVNPKNSINAIQSSQIAQVFAGEILVWPTEPLAGQSIAVVSREQGSGTRHAFETIAMQERRVTLTAVVMPSEAAVVDYVAVNPTAIGYVSMGGVTPNVRALTVDDYPLSPQTVESRQYPFVRTLALLVSTQPDRDVQGFVDYVLGQEGQAIVSQRFGRAP